MNFPLYIAKRYLFAKSGNNAINIITIIASIGVIVGTAALFIILEQFLGGVTENWQFWLGFILIIVVLFAKGGIIGMIAKERHNG